MYLPLHLFHDLFPLEYVFMSNSFMQWGEKSFYQFSNRMCLLVFIKRRSKARQKNMSCEIAFKFDKLQIFTENYKPIKDCFRLVY